ncbi:MAG TPA: hypothetical protein VF399_11410 [bacterium]
MLRRNARLFEELGSGLYFTVADLARVFDIKPESARVMASRYASADVFLRIKKDVYVLASNWRAYTLEQFMRLANIIQVPSHVSLVTALSYYGVTTQVQRNVIECVAQKRTVIYDIKGTVFNYYKLKKQYYFGFSRLSNSDVFISSKEKALVDALYLYSFGKYKIDIDALDLAKLDSGAIRKIIRIYPNRTQKIVKSLCRI